MLPQMRKRAVLLIVVTAVIVAGVTAVVVTRSGGQGTSAQAAVSAQHGGSVSLGDARLTVPAGAVSGSGQLVATAAGPPRAGYGTSALVGASAPVHFSVTGGAQVTGTLLITFRVPSEAVPASLPKAAAAKAVWLAFYDPAAKRWQGVPSSYDPASGTVTARVAHLSWWMPWTWDWAGMALRVRQALSAFSSGRVPAVTCPGVPGVTVTSADGQDPPMIGCAANTGTDTLTITLTNDRGLSMVLSSIPPDAKPGPPSYSGFYQYVATSTAATAMLGGVDLPPGGTRTYTLLLHGGPARFTAAPTIRSYILDLAATAADALIGKAKFQKVSGDYAKCAIDTIARTATPALASAADLAVACLPVLADQVPGYADLVKVIGKKALAVLQLAINDIKLLLQDGDLIYDDLRGIQGSVTIARPPCDAATCQPLPEVAFCLGGIYPDCVYQYHGIEPASIYFSTDNTVSIRGIKWSSWNETSATGSGEWYFVSCNPSCANGPVTRYPATLTLSNVQHGLFTVLTTTMQGKTSTINFTSPAWPQSAEGCKQSPTCNEAPGNSSSG